MPSNLTRGIHLRFDIYGRLLIEVIRDESHWRVFSCGAGKRTPLDDIVIPAEIPEHEIATYWMIFFMSSRGPAKPSGESANLRSRKTPGLVPLQENLHA